MSRSINSKNNRNIYLKEEYHKDWKEALKMFPYYLDMSVSDFCAKAVQEKVREIKRDNKARGYK